MDKKAKISYQVIIGWLLIGLSAIMLVKSITLCFSNDIWYDELFTVGMIEHSYGELIAFTARDVHPPLYYCIVKFIIGLCKLILPTANTVIISKIVSVLPYFILLLYSVTFIRKRFGIFTGGLFLFCVISMPQLSTYTVEVRMYSWALLFVTAAFLHSYAVVVGENCKAVSYKAGGDERYKTNQEKMVEQVGRRKADSSQEWQSKRESKLHVVAFVFYGLAAAYTQYFACVAVIMVYIYVLVAFLIQDRRRIRQWFICVAPSIVGYTPWLYVLYTQITAVNENYWILPLSWRTLGGCVKFLMKPAFTNEVLSIVLAVALFAVYFFVFICNVVRHYRISIVFDENIGYIESKDNSDDIEDDKNINNGNMADNIGTTNNSRNRNSNTGKDNNNYNVYITKQRNDFGFIIAGVGVLAGLVLFGFAASIVLRPIFVYRYMIPALGCFWMSFVVGLGVLAEQEKNQPTALFLTIKRKIITVTIHADRICKGVTIVICAFVLLIGLRDYRAFMGEEEYKTLLMKDTNTAFHEIGADDILIFNFDQVQMVAGYYIDNESYLWYGQPEALIQEISGKKGDLNEDIGQIKEWISQDKKVHFIGSFNSRENIVEEWRTAGITVDETGSYLLERYWFNIYELEINE